MNLLILNISGVEITTIISEENLPDSGNDWRAPCKITGEHAVFII